MKQRKGIALITVLMVSVVMMILLGSFVRLNLQNFGLMNNNLHQVASSEAARSAFDYCLYRLERNRNWGASKFEDGEDLSVSESLEIKKVEGSHTIKGKVLESGAEFEVEILNNINGGSKVDGVEEGMIRLRITAGRGSAQVTREAVMTTAPLFDGSVVASKAIDIDAESLTVSSEDPMRNRFRSKGKIKVPDYRGRLKFKPASEATERGVLWAKEGIQSGNKDLSDFETNQEAAEKTRGQFLPNANTHHDIYDLQLSEIATNERNVPVESGIYVFNRRTIEYAGNGEETRKSFNVPVLERRDWAVNSAGEIEGGNIQEIWFPKGSLPEGAKIQDYLNVEGVLAEKGIHAVGSSEFTIGGTQGGIKVNFNSLDDKYVEEGGEFKPPSLVLDSTANIDVNGDFGVTSFDPEFYPTIKFEDPKTGVVDGGDVEEGGIASSVVDVESSGASRVFGSGHSSGSITTRTAGGKPGSIYIAGAISGSGKLLADGNVTVRNTFASVSTDDQSDLSIFAGGNVTLRPQRARSIDANSIFAGTSEEAQGTTQFKGLVFAGKNVLIDANKTQDEDNPDKSDILFEGAVVARTGKVEVRSAKKANFRYNPELLDTILNPKKDARVRLERVVWKEF